MLQSRRPTVLFLVLLLIAQLCFSGDLVVQILGCVLLACSCIVSVSPSSEMEFPQNRRWLWGLVTVIVVGFCFRLAQITAFPAGLYVDETLMTRNAITADLSQMKLWGSTPLTDSGWVEISNLQVIYHAAIIRIFGPGLLGARMLSTSSSLFSIPLVFLVASHLLGRRAGVIACGLFAVSHWACRLSAVSPTHAEMMFLHLAAVAALLWGTKRRRTLGFILGGIALGLCMYTYVACRLVAAHIFLWAVWELCRAKDRRLAIRHWGSAIGLAVLIAGPHYLHLYLHRAGAANVRVDELSVFSAGFAEGIRSAGWNLWRHCLMFHGQGGAYARDNLPGTPMVDMMTGFGMLIGGGLCFRKLDRRSVLLATWFCVCVLGGVLSQSQEGAPYPLRVGNLVPWACILAALGFDWLLSVMPSKRGTMMVATVLPTAILCLNYSILFVQSPASSDIISAHGTKQVLIGRWAASAGKGVPVLVHQTVFQDRRVEWQGTSSANRENYYTNKTSAICMQIAAGCYESDPELIREPNGMSSPLRVVQGLPKSINGRIGIIVPVAAERLLALQYNVLQTYPLKDPKGRVLCIAAIVESRTSLR